MNSYPDIPKAFLNFNVNEDSFHNGRDVNELLWPFLNQYRNCSFKIADLQKCFTLPGDEIMQLLHYMLKENLVYYSTPHCDFGAWEYAQSQALSEKLEDENPTENSLVSEPSTDDIQKSISEVSADADDGLTVSIKNSVDTEELISVDI